MLAPAHIQTRNWAIQTAQQYTSDFQTLQITEWVWMGLLAILIFSIVRAVLSAALSTIALFILMNISGRGGNGRG